MEGVTNRMCGKHDMIAVQNKKPRVVPTCPVYKVKIWNRLQRLEESVRVFKIVTIKEVKCPDKTNKCSLPNKTHEEQKC